MKRHEYKISWYQINVQSLGSCYSIYVKIYSGGNCVLLKAQHERWANDKSIPTTYV